MRFEFLPVRHFDTVGVPLSIKGIAFDSNAIIAELNERGAQIVVSHHLRRAMLLQIEADICKRRHLIENVFERLSELKRIAMRSDKTDQGFSVMIYLAFGVIHSRRTSAHLRCGGGCSH